MATAETPLPTDPLAAETTQFIRNLRAGCAKIGCPPEIYLAIRLFETGGTLSARYSSNKNTYTAYGLLQFTVEGCEPLRPFVGVAKHTGDGADNTEKNRQAYQIIKRKNRLEQLDLSFKHYEFWQTIPSVKAKIAQYEKINPDYVWYGLTLNPANWEARDDNKVKAKEIIAFPNYKNCKAQAIKMLNGEIGIPNDPPGEPFIGENAAAAYMKKVGSTKVPVAQQNGAYISPGSNSAIGSGKGTETEKKKKSIDDILPVKCNISIPEYPRLLFIMPGDVIIFPPTSQLRDWVVTSVDRKFRPGLNELRITCNRPLDPTPFVQNEVLNQSTTNKPMSYYWLLGN